MLKISRKYRSVVVPFGLIVEILNKVHVQLAHIGRPKLVDLVLRNFWHPAIEKIAGDICSVCDNCQYFKVSSQHIVPPTRKIVTSHPFAMVVIDVMLLPKMSRNNIAVVVAVDHHTKWLTAIPVRDKKSSTIKRIFLEQILSNFPKIPSRLLSDNGVEFKSKEFNDVLDSYNIVHVYSSPYTASSNGCVEGVTDRLYNY